MAAPINKIAAWLLVATGFKLIIFSLAGCKAPASEEEVLAMYLQRGDSISRATTDTLRHTLMQAIATKGLPGAVSFCNEKALAITGTYAAAGVTIQRVAERCRNASNQLDSLDAVQMQRYAAIKERGDSLSGIALRRGNEVVYYKPILLQPLCTSCHGNRETIPPALLATIDSLYPNDQATGFTTGDIRGMWKITFHQ